MSKRFAFILGATALLLSGCGTSEGPTEARPLNVVHPPPPAPAPERSLVQLLRRPRPELAELCDRWTEKVQQQHITYRQGQVRFELLPDVRLPLALPVWQQAKYSAKAGLSLPPYAKEGARDSVLALHLARFGDTEAARQLAGPDVRDRLDKLRLARNYPVEWTRLAALMLQDAEFRLATGDADAAHDLLKVHKEIRAALDADAQKGPLGAALLPHGWGVLRQAVAVWKKEGKTDQAALAEAGLAGWGDAPPFALAVAPGALRADVVRLFGNPGQGRAVLATSVPRALDLLGLPLPGNGAEAVVACFDVGDQLSEVLVIYGAGISQEYPQPVQLGHRLEEHTPGETLPGGLPRRRYPLSGTVCQVIGTPGSPYAGAIVQLGKASTAVGLPRDFGPLSLDRSFGMNRSQAAPQLVGGRLVLDDAKLLSGLRLPLPLAERETILLQRDPSLDLVASLTLQYKPTPRRRSFANTALPLWQAFGAAPISGSTKDVGRLVLCWEDRKTSYTLALPHEAEAAPELVIADRAEGEALRQRAETVHALDLQARRERLQKQRPWIRLPRELERVQLGQTRAEVLAQLPRGEHVLKRELPDGLLVTFLGASGNSAKQTRELFVHFGPTGRTDAVRVRYTDTRPGATRAYMKALQVRLGMPDEGASPTGPRVLHWTDDRSDMVCQLDSSGLDVVLRDWPPDSDRVAESEIEYLPCGLADCVLGMSRRDLLRKWHLDEKTTAVPLVVTPDGGGLYDALLFWFEEKTSGDPRVVRIVARHKQPDQARMSPADASRAVAEAWGREAATLGWPRRKEPRVWSTQDDRTQVRIFWQQNPGEAPRVYTEWTVWRKSR
jgi:hypothetical protein